MKKNRKILNDFQKNEAGNYEYAGVHMICSLPEGEYRRNVFWLLLPALLSTALDVAAGCLPGTGMEGCFYLLLPYAGGLVAMLLLVWTLVQMLHAGPRLRAYTYDRIMGALPRRAMFAVMLGGAGLLGLCFGLVTGTYAGYGMEGLLFGLSQIVQLAAAVWVHRESRKLEWKAGVK